MSTVLIRLLTLHAENVIPEVIWALIAIYCLALLVTVTSVWTTYKTFQFRFFWLVVIICLPVVGIMAHCFYNLTLAELPALKQLGIFTRKSA